MNVFRICPEAEEEELEQPMCLFFNPGFFFSLVLKFPSLSHPQSKSIPNSRRREKVSCWKRINQVWRRWKRELEKEFCGNGSAMNFLHFYFFFPVDWVCWARLKHGQHGSNGKVTNRPTLRKRVENRQGRYRKISVLMYMHHMRDVSPNRAKLG